jgi:hypothetical protein
VSRLFLPHLHLRSRPQLVLNVPGAVGQRKARPSFGKSRIRSGGLLARCPRKPWCTLTHLWNVSRAII